MSYDISIETPEETVTTDHIVVTRHVTEDGILVGVGCSDSLTAYDAYAMVGMLRSTIDEMYSPGQEGQDQ